MNDFMKSIGSLFGGKAGTVKTMSKEEIAAMLQTSPEALQAFEESYQKAALSNELPDNFFDINAKQMSMTMEGVDTKSNPKLEDLIDRIVKELLNGTIVWSYDGKHAVQKTLLSDVMQPLVTNDDLKMIPENQRPQLTGHLLKVDINSPSYIALLENYKNYEQATNEKDKRMWYHLFRQGLDILDVDSITSEIIGMNPNSMGHWLPQIVDAASRQNFFQIPKTTIIKIPTPMLQLTRLDYQSLTRSTLDIVDRYCHEVFDLDDEKEYFIKTGTYSSKFDFRNARVSGPKEVRELGEYLLFIHHQACQMASPLNNRSIYGVSTTNEWVVREFIEDKDSTVSIYKGLPLHTEYRIFVDFDTKQIIGAFPYWDPDMMKQRFGHEDDADSPHMKHDYITFCLANERLMERYNKNIEQVKAHVQQLVEDATNISGQWSIDIMQNGNEFWLIDMALAENSAFVERIPKTLLNPSKEEWIPKIEM